MRILRHVLIITFALLGMGSWTVAQPLGTPVPTGILVIDSDRFFEQSRFGRAVRGEVDAAQNQLLEENQRIEGELEAEEKSLAEARGGMSAEEFSVLSEAFDKRVQDIRRVQDSKSLEIARRQERLQGLFVNAARPILISIMTEYGATVILEQRSVLLSSNAADVTDLAISRLNETIGDGKHLFQQE